MARNNTAHKLILVVMFIKLKLIFIYNLAPAGRFVLVEFGFASHDASTLLVKFRFASHDASTLLVKFGFASHDASTLLVEFRFASHDASTLLVEFGFASHDASTLFVKLGFAVTTARVILVAYNKKAASLRWKVARVLDEVFVLYLSTIPVVYFRLTQQIYESFGI